MQSGLERKPRKLNFKLRNDKNGLILKYHNTRNIDGKLVRIRFVNGCFNYNSTKFVAIDHRGNVFVFDFIYKKIWKTFDKCPRNTAIQCNTYSLNEFFVGTKYGEIFIIDIEKGSVRRLGKYCLLPIQIISIPVLSAFQTNILVASRTEAILIDIKTFQANYSLEFNNANDIINAHNKHTQLKFISFLPNCEKIIACFSNDSVHIWSAACLNGENKNANYGSCQLGGKSEGELNSGEDMVQSKLTLKIFRILYPLKIRDRQLRLTKDNKYKELKISEKIDYEHNFNSNQIGDTVKILNKITIEDDINDYSTGLIHSFDFSLDGKYMCLTTLDKYILLFSTITFELVKIIKTKDISIQKCLCFEKLFYDTGKNSSCQISLIAIALTSQSDIILIDLNDLIV
ncbi:uncharacterized protein LOC129610790, partial [Condylostylus longicornis]|uniref:uncharacterized protein LOC129610790 n=1 Tax=Condylostylus longicornis TaxID=2530218 RepID=UPI00244DFA01